MKNREDWNLEDVLPFLSQKDIEPSVILGDASIRLFWDDYDIIWYYELPFSQQPQETQIFINKLFDE